MSESSQGGMTKQYFISKIFLSFIALVIANALYAQGQGSQPKGKTKIDKKYEKNLANQARTHMAFGEFEEAQKTYSKLIEVNSGEPQYFFEYGVSYLEGSKQKENSIKYLELAVAKSKEEPNSDYLYYLGRAYQAEHRFGDAMETYNKYLVLTNDNKKLNDERLEVENRIRMCQHGQYQLSQSEVNPTKNKDQYKNIYRYFINPTDYIAVENLGKNINSPFNDYGPILMDQAQILTFTSRQSIQGRNEELSEDNQFFENIFVSKYRDGSWQETVEIDYSSFFNSAVKNDIYHNSALSSDANNKYIIYLNNNLLYIATRNTNRTWNEGVKINADFNDGNMVISSSTILPNGKTIYICAYHKKQGFGGKDIYKAVKNEDGSWGKLENLGGTINTKFNEDSPYITSDGKTLYFASEGHSSIGGYDIFKSSLVNGEWSTPINLGLPINTPEDEIHYYPSIDESYAFYASSRNGGMGGLDIYKTYRGRVEQMRVEFTELAATLLDKAISIKNADEVAFLNRAPKFEDTPEIAAIVKEQEKEEKAKQEALAALKEAKEKEKAQAEALAQAQAQIEEGKKEDLKPKEDKIVKPAESKTPTEKIVKEDKVQESEVVETKQPSTSKSAALAEVTKNIPFNFNGAQMSAETKAQMDELVKYLAENPNEIIEVHGHTDSKGSDEVNMIISKQRALFVFNYLVDQGANPYQVNYNYFGKTKPLVANENPDGTDNPANRAQNRRVDFVVESNKLFEYAQFDFNSFALNADVKLRLDKVAVFLQNNSGTVADIRGFTDSTGDPAYNVYLSEKRANSVSDYLKEKGVAQNQLKISFFGPDSPTIPNDTQSKRKLNRRVEIRIN